MTDRLRCYYCGKFVSWVVWSQNWRMIQAPGVADPEPYEISWCNDCDHIAADQFRATDAYVARQAGVTV